MLHDKIYTDLERLSDRIEKLRDSGKSIVWTNGCFDLLHAGHVTYLEEAAGLGDVLLVGLNSDASVRAVKGEGRPVNAQADRAVVVAGLASVGLVYIFDDHDATAILDRLRPEVYAKGGDYTIDTVHQGERRLVEEYGGRVAVLRGLEGRSTTETIRRLSS